MFRVTQLVSREAEIGTHNSMVPKALALSRSANVKKTRVKIGGRGEL